MIIENLEMFCFSCKLLFISNLSKKIINLLLLKLELSIECSIFETVKFKKHIHV
jgi:hypothetical protein